MKWIDIKERIPRLDKNGESERVLAYLGDDCFFVVHFVEKKYKWGNDIRAYEGGYPLSDNIFSMITHWAKITPPNKNT